MNILIVEDEKIAANNLEKMLHKIDENVFLCTKDKKNYPIDYSLDKLENILAPKKFFRINRQFIVSFDAIENMFFLSKSRIKIILKQNPDKETIVSYSRLSDFRKWLNQ